MLNQEVDNLIKTLTSLSLHWERISCILDVTNELESELLQDLEAAKIAVATAAAAIEVVTDTNPRLRGDLVSSRTTYETDSV